MNQGDQERPVNNSGEISIVDLINKIRSMVRYLKGKWLTILIAGFLGGAIGLIYSILKKPTYTAVCTFVLDDAKNGGIGQYSGLASLAGVNIGEGGGGIFSGDNILELYKSRTMIEKTLLTPCMFNGKKQLLIDRFIDYNNLRSKEKGDDKIGWVNFNGNSENFGRVQDSVVTSLVELFNKNVLDVDKLDKKLNIISVKVVTRDEIFSKYFTERLVQTVNDFYIQTKTKKASQNVQILQHQADSVRTMLNFSIHGVASAIDADPDANPLMATLRVASQKKQIDVQANTAIYSEMVKNLELAKISLRQEMPLIQVIDKPVLPLKKEDISKLKGLVVGLFVGMFTIAFILILKKILEKLHA
jgi:hypothetical protein